MTQDTAFTDVDSSPFADAALAYVEQVAARPDVRAWQALADDLLDLRPGHRLLDVGCGIGTIARELVPRTRPGGEAVAVDLSSLMIAEAARRHDPALPVRYQVADATALPFPDAAFDVVRCEQVLQLLPDPDVALAELVRVASPGGRVCVLDVDWATMVIDVGDDALAERAWNGFLAGCAQPRMGRTLRRRFAAAGLRNVTVRTATFTLTSLADAAQLCPPVFDARAGDAADVVPVTDRDAWFAALDRADRAEELTAVGVGFVVGGQLPDLTGQPTAASTRSARCRNATWAAAERSNISPP